ncbi:hypothetical protein M0657_006889 [Pyricularia oryzae]|nr:hypothetical protein MCOR30_008627 [Pyricularia oryzae]KAI6474224.1 hypothetical protein MCOR18_007921 [Pyricularia oryzae]KAI6594938.1 hypothetical protein MCOR12_006686 [Pyricularia oryzae]KAI7919184.1 hypothetical protein M9X92_006495 [Pyricularia oryzae]KAI7919892.1 hypothetical protein M0657_006889 [Pyricularia oryzae]
MLGRVGTFLPPQPKGFNSKTGLAGGKYGLPAQVAVCFLMHDNRCEGVPDMSNDWTAHPEKNNRTKNATSNIGRQNRHQTGLCFLGKPIGAC